MRRQKIGRSVVEKSRAEIVLKKKPGKSEGRKKYGLTAALQQTEIFILDFVAANEKKLSRSLLRVTLWSSRKYGSNQFNIISLVDQIVFFFSIFQQCD